MYIDPALDPTIGARLGEWIEHGKSDDVREVSRQERGISVVEIHGQQFIVKTIPLPTSWSGKVRRKLFGSASFKCEWRVNVAMNETASQYSDARFPRMLASDCKSCMVFEHISGTLRPELTAVQSLALVKGLVDFQLHTPLLRPSIYGRIVGMWMRDRSRIHVSDVLFVAKRMNSARFLSRASRIVIALSRRAVRPRIDTMTHGDLYKGNIICCGDVPYLIDFANSRRSGKWIFRDIAHASVDRDRYFINHAALRAYCAEVVQRRMFAKDQVAPHLHYSLLERIIFLLSVIDLDSPTGVGYLKFFDEVLSSEERFSRWFADNVWV
jgi:hypothetical protein